MRRCTLKRTLLIFCAVIIALCFLAQGVSAAEIDIQLPVLDQQDPTESTEVDERANSTEPTADTETEDGDSSFVEGLVQGILQGFLGSTDSLSNAVLNSLSGLIYRQLLDTAETIISSITNSSSSVFNYSWFKVTASLFSRFGMLMFAVGVVLTFVDAGIEYRRRGIDLSGTMLNLGKGLIAVGLFAAIPVPLFNFCTNIQSVILDTLAIEWNFQETVDALQELLTSEGVLIIMIVIMIVLIFLIYLDSLKRGGILLVLICIGSLHMISVPRGYLDNFYSWCKQVIALCLTVLLQNLLLFCGLMIVPTQVFLGLGVMFAAKEVPRICAQFGLDTSVKASFTNIAMGANASVQAVKAASALLA